MLEKDFQSKLIKKIKTKFPDCEILKNDSSYLQGVPDLLILNDKRWAMLEVKKSENELPSPNQKYYVRKFNRMSYARFIDPVNQEEVLYELEHLFKS